MSFWSDADDEHKSIAETFYRNVEYDHPDYVTSDRLSPYAKWGEWEATAVKYYKYNGPNVTNL
jgi:hypothetical protein